MRRNVLKYDDVMNQQREVIYRQRREVIEGGDMRQRIADMRHAVIEEHVKRFCPDAANDASWDIAGLGGELERLCLLPGQTKAVFDALKQQTIEGFVAALEEASQKIYAQREALFVENGMDMREVERILLLRSVDRRWMDHIDAMDQLREGIGLRAYGQPRSGGGIQARGLRNVRGNGAPDPGGHHPPALFRRARAPRGAQGSGHPHHDIGRRRAPGQSARARRAQNWQQRSLSLRQRQKVQELLHGQGSGREKRAVKPLRAKLRAGWNNPSVG